MSMRGHGTESGREAVKTSAAGRAEENAHDAIEKMDHSAVTDMAEASDRREEPGAESFFFKAEDGIRDTKVTGVQTCVLPIYRNPTVHCGQWADANGHRLYRQAAAGFRGGRGAGARVDGEDRRNRRLSAWRPDVHRDQHQIGRASCRERV